MTTSELREQLGPLADLVGIWEGDKGDDVAPSDDRGSENNKYRERIVGGRDVVAFIALPDPDEVGQGPQLFT
jgi:hypothetical protein